MGPRESHSLARKVLLLLSSPYLTPILRVVLGALFVWASWEKILYPARLAEDVANYAILPPLLVNLWSLFLPWLEMIGGLFLILGFLTRSSSLVLSATLMSFIIAISINIARGTQIDCGCFGPGEELGWSTLLRDLLMLAMGVLILLFDRGFLALDSLLSHRIPACHKK